jgi:hypothetical protein
LQRCGGDGTHVECLGSRGTARIFLEGLGNERLGQAVADGVCVRWQSWMGSVWTFWVR